ncbi:ketopantoate reductase family protein [Treponema denticola]|uniref:ketopantoate reductase family protein n=1 Tax=Treponema denticola TaxID=158 RepID=UPI0020A2EFE3|nr:hypothetical protein [Treponema denticola]UTC81668.1 hypothetical protein HGJ18_10995 [Treponema denticola]
MVTSLNELCRECIIKDKNVLYLEAGSKMKLLIYGAGVIGSLYAAAFAEAGYDITFA